MGREDSCFVFMPFASCSPGVPRPALFFVQKGCHAAASGKATKDKSKYTCMLITFLHSLLPSFFLSFWGVVYIIGRQISCAIQAALHQQCHHILPAVRWYFLSFVPDFFFFFSSCSSLYFSCSSFRLQGIKWRSLSSAGCLDRSCCASCFCLSPWPLLSLRSSTSGTGFG